MEPEPKTSFNIEKISPKNIDEANEMRLQSWLDTYVNEELGVTREWIEARNKDQMSDEVRRKRLERMSRPDKQAWVATDAAGKVIGVTSPYTDEDGVQHVGSLYVDKEWHGKGVAGKLMQKVIEFLDSAKPIELGVVTYNERAKAFYRKWGFVEIPGSESLFDDKIPEVKMVRPPGQELQESVS